VVWRLNQPKQEGICKRNTAVQCRLPTHCATKHVFKSEKCSQVSDFVWPSRTTQANLLLLRQHVSMEQHDHRLLKLQDDVSRERDVPPPLRSSPRYRLVGGVGQHGRKHYQPAQWRLSGRGELLKMLKTIPSLVERLMIFISETEFNDPVLF